MFVENMSHLIREKRVSEIESSYYLGTDEKGNSAYSLGTEGAATELRSSKPPHQRGLGRHRNPTPPYTSVLRPVSALDQALHSHCLDSKDT